MLHMGVQETPHEILKLPEQGRQLVREVEQQLPTGDWDLAEKALLALKALAQMPGGSKIMQVGLYPAWYTTSRHLDE